MSFRGPQGPNGPVGQKTISHYRILRKIGGCWHGRGRPSFRLKVESYIAMPLTLASIADVLALFGSGKSRYAMAS